MGNQIQIILNDDAYIRLKAKKDELNITWKEMLLSSLEDKWKEKEPTVIKESVMVVELIYLLKIEPVFFAQKSVRKNTEEN